MHVACCRLVAQISNFQAAYSEKLEAQYNTIMIGMQQNVKRLSMSSQKMKSTIFLTENKKSLPNIPAEGTMKRKNSSHMQKE